MTVHTCEFDSNVKWAQNVISSILILKRLVQYAGFCLENPMSKLLFFFLYLKYKYIY